MRDGGWAVIITDPDGYTLGGELAGIHIHQGAFAFYGDYNILVTNPAGKPIEEVILSYRADTFKAGPPPLVTACRPQPPAASDTRAFRQLARS